MSLKPVYVLFPKRSLTAVIAEYVCPVSALTAGLHQKFNALGVLSLMKSSPIT